VVWVPTGLFITAHIFLVPQGYEEFSIVYLAACDHLATFSLQHVLPWITDKWIIRRLTLVTTVAAGRN
jgi:hypothetical protein